MNSLRAQCMLELWKKITLIITKKKSNFGEQNTLLSQHTTITVFFLSKLTCNYLKTNLNRLILLTYCVFISQSLREKLLRPNNYYFVSCKQTYIRYLSLSNGILDGPSDVLIKKNGCGRL